MLFSKITPWKPTIFVLSTCIQVIYNTIIFPNYKCALRNESSAQKFQYCEKAEDGSIWRSLMFKFVIII